MKTAKQLVVDLYADGNGLSDQKIGDIVGASQPSIWRIRNADAEGGTKNCKSKLYIALLDLHQKTFGEGKRAASKEKRRAA